MTGLRPHQVRAIGELYAKLREGKRRVLVTMPTAAGKSRFAAHVASEVRGGVLWLTHRTDLVTQSLGVLRGQGLHAGALCASVAGEADASAPVQVASVQTLRARGERPPAKLVIVDECHAFVADEFAAVVADYPDARVVGLTATPERGDGRGLGEMFEDVVIGATTAELVEAGYLVHADIVRPSQRMRPGTVAASPVEAYLAHATGRRAISFTATVQIAVDHAVEFSAAGVRAEVISADTPAAKRARILDAFRRGEIDVLSNVYCLTEGIDVPEISCVILARGCGTLGTYIQMVGRGLRCAPGKTDCVVLDLTGVSHVHGHPEDPLVVSLDGRGMSRTKADKHTYCAVCGAIVTEPPCPDCGSLAAPMTLRVARSTLVRYAHKRRETTEERAASLRRWRAEAKARGHNPKAALGKYYGVYGVWPTRDVERMSRGS